jgi:hypothetical protein
MTDVLAERVRSICGTTLRSISHVARLQRIRDNEEDFVAPIDMLRELMEDNKAFIVNIRATHEMASENNDVTTASILENFIDETQRTPGFSLRRAELSTAGMIRQEGSSLGRTGHLTLDGPSCDLMTGIGT